MTKHFLLAGLLALLAANTAMAGERVGEDCWLYHEINNKPLVTKAPCKDSNVVCEARSTNCYILRPRGDQRNHGRITGLKWDRNILEKFVKTYAQQRPVQRKALHKKAPATTRAAAAAPCVNPALPCGMGPKLPAKMARKTASKPVFNTGQPKAMGLLASGGDIVVDHGARPLCPNCVFVFVHIESSRDDAGWDAFVDSAYQDDPSFLVP